MFIEAIIIGCITGFVSAFFGIGGSSIDTPLLRIFLNLPPYIALASPLPTAFLTIAIALFAFWKKHLVNFRVFKWSLAGGLPGIILGSYLSQDFSGKFLMLFNAVILFFVGADLILKKFKDRKNKNYNEQIKKVPALHFVGVSLISGILSGILAIGGGLFLIPSYVLIFKMKMKEAIATSLLTVTMMFLPALIIHYYLGHIDLRVSAAMGIGIIPMAYIGARMDLKTESDTIQLLFGLMLIAFSIYFFISQLGIGF